MWENFETKVSYCADGRRWRDEEVCGRGLVDALRIHFRWTTREVVLRWVIWVVMKLMFMNSPLRI
jgi:hypothetical protein